MKSQIINIQGDRVDSRQKAYETTCMVQGLHVLMWRFFLIDVFTLSLNRDLDKDHIDPDKNDKGRTHFRELLYTCVSLVLLQNMDALKR